MISQMTPTGLQPGEPAEIDRGLGLAGAHQHAAVPRPQREHVAGLHQVLRLRVRVGEHAGSCARGPPR